MSQDFDWAEFEQTYRPAARRVARGLVSDPDAARAVVDEAFAAVRESTRCGDRYSASLGSRRADLFTGLVDRAVLVTGMGHESRTSSPPAAGRIAPGLERNHRDLARGLARLDPLSRRVLELWFAGGGTLEAVADETHLALVSVEATLVDALPRLRPWARGCSLEEARAIAELVNGHLGAAAARAAVALAPVSAAHATTFDLACELVAAAETARARVYHPAPSAFRWRPPVGIAVAVLFVIGLWAIATPGATAPVELGHPAIDAEDPALRVPTGTEAADLEREARTLYAAADHAGVATLLADRETERTANPRLALLLGASLLALDRAAEAADALAAPTTSADSATAEMAGWLLGHARYASGDRAGAVLAWLAVAEGGGARAAEAREALRAAGR